MSSAFLSPIGGHPIDPEEADDELDADQVHKEWKGYYEHWKRKGRRQGAARICRKQNLAKRHKILKVSR